MEAGSGCWCTEKQVLSFESLCYSFIVNDLHCKPDKVLSLKSLLLHL
jgi:hypothetical protein